MGVITRIGRAAGVRRLVKKRDSPAESREDPDGDERDPRWCATCRREVLLGAARCPECGGTAVTATELARRSGNPPSPPGRGPADW